MTADRLSRAAAPWFSTDPSSDQQADVVRGLAKAGKLDGNLAVVALVADSYLLHKSIEPALAEARIHPVATSVIDAPPDDTAATLAAAKTISENFKSTGATKVLVVGNSATAWLGGIEKTDYRPQNIFTITSTAKAFANDSAGHDLSVLNGAITGDTYGPVQAAYNEPNMQKCIAVLKKAGLDEPEPPTSNPPGQPQPFVSAITACKNMTLFEAIVKAAGKDLYDATFRAAGNNLGDLPMPGSPQPYHYGAPPHADVDPPVFPYHFDTATKSFAIDA